MFDFETIGTVHVAVTKFSQSKVKLSDNHYLRSRLLNVAPSCIRPPNNATIVAAFDHRVPLPSSPPPNTDEQSVHHQIHFPIQKRAIEILDCGKNMFSNSLVDDEDWVKLTRSPSRAVLESINLAQKAQVRYDKEAESESATHQCSNYGSISAQAERDDNYAPEMALSVTDQLMEGVDTTRLQKSTYNAKGLLKDLTMLTGSCKFDNALSLKLTNDHPSMQIIHRKVSLILGQWVSKTLKTPVKVYCSGDTVDRRKNQFAGEDDSVAPEKTNDVISDVSMTSSLTRLSGNCIFVPVLHKVSLLVPPVS
ncbi:hypothetical protein LXL04_006404 [Taraxacum kok-saghyz]